MKLKETGVRRPSKDPKRRQGDVDNALKGHRDLVAVSLSVHPIHSAYLRVFRPSLPRSSR